jgi:hypothetical protein
MISLTTSKKVDQTVSNALAKACGAGISLLPGKSEAHLMLSFRGDVPMYFAGKNGDYAFFDVQCFGASVDKGGADKLTAVLCKAAEAILGIPGSGVYVKYSATTVWGWNGGNF